jgi:choline transport protein
MRLSIANQKMMNSTAGFALGNGGTGGLIYVYIGTVIGFTLIILSMAEMASMAPTAGGQYHWVSEFAPRSAQRFLSYFIGWLCVLGWQAGTASSCFLAGTEVQGLLVLNYDSYVYKHWHGTLLTIAIVVVCATFNTFLAKRLPLVEGIVLVLHVAGFFGILIPLWVLAPRSSSREVWTVFEDAYGWGNKGLACLVGIISPVLSLLGADAATHMSEELKNASKTLPRAMVSTAIFNGSLGFIMVVLVSTLEITTVAEKLILGMQHILLHRRRRRKCAFHSYWVSR